MGEDEISHYFLLTELTKVGRNSHLLVDLPGFAFASFYSRISGQAYIGHRPVWVGRNRPRVLENTIVQLHPIIA